MKRILTAAALAALIATPALAAPRHYRAQPVQAIEAPVVIEDGHYRGADPDVAVRLDLRRDNQSYRG